MELLTDNNTYLLKTQNKKRRVQLIFRATLGVIFKRRLNLNLQFPTLCYEYYSSSAPTAFDFQL